MHADEFIQRGEPFLCPSEVEQQFIFCQSEQVHVFTAPGEGVMCACFLPKRKNLDGDMRCNVNVEGVMRGQPHNHIILRHSQRRQVMSFNNVTCFFVHGVLKLWPHFNVIRMSVGGVLDNTRYQNTYI